LLITKLYIPTSGKIPVHRSLLFNKINEVLNRKLTQISAHAGYGKTTLISLLLGQILSSDNLINFPSGGNA